MEQGNIKCPKCKGNMEKGVFADRGYYSMIMGSLLWGSALSFLGGLKNKRNVTAYRCKNCGFIESYTE
jgi:predicted nucleic-acid-binding Zn-ribbon protein